MPAGTKLATISGFSWPCACYVFEYAISSTQREGYVIVCILCVFCPVFISLMMAQYARDMVNAKNCAYSVYSWILIDQFYECLIFFFILTHFD
jgi:hypothetical protein